MNGEGDKVPAINSINNVYMDDVIGNKDDTPSGSSIVSLSKKNYNETEYIDHHIHTKTRSYGKSANQSGNNWAEEASLTAFRAISGNGDYGSDPNDEAKIFGTDDTPIIPGQTLYDPAGILVTGVSSDFMYHLRFIWSLTTMADGIAAGDYSMTSVKFDSANPQESAGIPIPIHVPKLPVGYKLWVQAKHSVDNAYIDFYMTNTHGYA